MTGTDPQVSESSLGERNTTAGFSTQGELTVVVTFGGGVIVLEDAFSFLLERERGGTLSCFILVTPHPSCSQSDGARMAGQASKEGSFS